MSIEHPTCPYCGEPLDKIIEKGLEKHSPCAKLDCSGQQLNREGPKVRCWIFSVLDVRRNRGNQTPCRVPFHTAVSFHR
jgi:hypothetical protein